MAALSRPTNGAMPAAPHVGTGLAQPADFVGLTETDPTPLNWS
jgi:hypothetical protein